MPETAVSVGANVVGGLIQDNASDKAKKAHNQAADKALALQEEMYEQTREDLKPFRESGVGANQKLSFLMGIGSPNDGIDRDSIRQSFISKYPGLFSGVEDTRQKSAGRSVLESKDYAQLGPLKTDAGYTYTPDDLNWLSDAVHHKRINYNPDSLYDVLGGLAGEEGDRSQYMGDLTNMMNALRKHGGQI